MSHGAEKVMAEKFVEVLTKEEIEKLISNNGIIPVDKYALEAITKSTEVFVRCIMVLLKKIKKEGSVDKNDFLTLLDKIKSRGFDWEFLSCIFYDYYIIENRC